jgi:hypothetical protein
MEQIMTTNKEQKNSIRGIIHGYKGNKKLGHKTNQDFMRTKFIPRNKSWLHKEGKKLAPVKQITTTKVIKNSPRNK